MKKIILTTVLFFSITLINAQEYKSLAGTVGILNSKARVQYEHQIKDNITIGGQLTYYFDNWTGPKLEVFGRLYSKKSNIEEGFFLQGKLGYGNLSVLDGEEIYNHSTKRWSTFGVGAATGWKYMFSDKLGIEMILGLHFYTAPNSYDGYDDDYGDYGDYEDAFEDVGWFVTTGLPLDFQLKLVYKL